jgi:hypothetical protein
MALIVKLNRFLFLFVFITAGTRGLAQTNNSWQSSILKSFFLGEGKQDGLHSRKRIHFYGERRLLDVSHVYDPLCMRRAFDKILTAVYTFSSLSTACIRTPHAWCWEHILFALLFSPLYIWPYAIWEMCCWCARTVICIRKHVHTRAHRSVFWKRPEREERVMLTQFAEPHTHNTRGLIFNRHDAAASIWISKGASCPQHLIMRCASSVQRY